MRCPEGCVILSEAANRSAVEGVFKVFAVYAMQQRAFQ